MLARFLHIILAALLLISSTGFTLSSHRCGGKLVDVSLFGTANDCYGTATVAPCAVAEQPRCKNGCCDTEQDYFKADIDELQMLFSYDLSVPVLFFVSTPITLANTISPQRIRTVLPPIRPPLIRPNVQILFQIFRL